jgi:PTH2 family peptidyl-tRNA hydrolase
MNLRAITGDRRQNGKNGGPAVQGPFFFADLNDPCHYLFDEAEQTDDRIFMAEEPVFAYKQCILIRTDLPMSCGKRCAQAAHASIGAFEQADKALKKSWLSEGQKKVVLKAKDERTLHEMKVFAERSGIAASLIQDAGMTEIPPGTITALGLGPAKSADLDRITGNLPLL